MTTRFVHLHLHTGYSLVDSVIRIKDLVRAATDARTPAVAVTAANVTTSQAVIAVVCRRDFVGIITVTSLGRWVLKPLSKTQPSVIVPHAARLCTAIAPLTGLMCRVSLLALLPAGDFAWPACGPN